jgi:hypothetical protein
MTVKAIPSIVCLDGAPVSSIQIDTSTVATDTIDYVVTDLNSLTATSTRTVIVRAPDSAESPTWSTSTRTDIIQSAAAAPASPLTADASTTTATTTPKQ